MVARVDRALKDDLGIEDGLAAENVYVLDPCCGTGAYLAETLKRIVANLRGKGLGALTGARVKQETPVLVILGNPPYNGFAGMAVDEERELSEAYRTVKRVRRPEGQGLNDLYVRFFRMAERRIAEKTGRGVVCFISNYSGWTGCPSPECGSATWRPSTPSASIVSTATSTRRARPRPTAGQTPASSPRRATRWVYRWAPPSPRWSGRPNTRPLRP